MNSLVDGFAGFLRDSGVSDDAVFAAKLVSCELITNVVRHMGDSAEFCGELLVDCISVEVSSENFRNFDLHPDLPDVFSESGRGLYIINSVSDGGVQRSRNGLIVYIKRS